MLAAALPFLDAGLRGRGPGRPHLPAGDRRPALPRELGERARAVESDPRMSLLGSRAPGRADDVPPVPGAGHRRGRGRRIGAAARRRRGRLRHRPRRLARGPALRVGLQPAAGRGARVGDLPVRPAPAARGRGRQRGGHPSAPGPRRPRGRASAGFQDPGVYVPSLPLPRAPVEDGDPVFSVDDAPTLAGLRHQLGAVLATLVTDRDQQEDLHLAASEIAANAFRHGVRPVSARVWADGDRSSASSATAAPPTATRSAASRPPTASTSPSAGWACGWPASSGTTSTCCPPTQGLSVRLSTRLR